MTDRTKRKILKKAMKQYKEGKQYLWTGKEGNAIKELIQQGYLRQEAFKEIF